MNICEKCGQKMWTPHTCGVLTLADVAAKSDPNSKEMQRLATVLRRLNMRPWYRWIPSERVRDWFDDRWGIIATTKWKPHNYGRPPR